jgi:putative membrane protein
MKSNKVISKIVASTLLCSMVGYTLPVFAYTKDETVYSKLDSEGKNYKTIVSTHIENSEYADTINDMSDLLNIKNTSGDETYTQDGNKFVWNANKNDIYYQGESEKELPIECEVKYELDGKEVSANEIAGKSGKVKITLQYKNKEERTININGKDEKMYVPFVVVAGTIIKNENARNIEISSGKVVDDGTKTVIVGMAMPGLQESLGISSDEIDIPNNIEITMDATNFETSSIMSYVTPKVIEEDDLTIFDDLDEMYNKVNTLQSSMNQIQDGANTLKDGTTELEAGANTLKNGVNTAYSGAQTITSEVEKSTQSLKNDNSEALDNATLESIKKQAAESSKLTDEQKAQIKAQAQSGATLTQEQKKQISAQAKEKAVLTETQKTQITAVAKQGAVLTDAQKAQIKTQAKEKAVLTDAQKTQIIANAQSAYPTTLTETEKALILTTAQNTATQTAVATALETAQSTATKTAVATALNVAQQIATQTAETTALETAQQIATQTAITTALSTAQSTATTTAMQTSTTVAKQVGNQAKKTFTNKVVSQMSTLGNGLNQLTSGLSELNNGATTLANGTTQINDGATTLADGIKTFNEEGIEKICNYINGDAKDLTTRVEKLTELSKEYNNFTMLDGENSGEVKFIMIIDAVKQQTENEQNKEEAIVEENK